MRGANFWESGCGKGLLRVVQENYGTIIAAVAQRAFDLRDVDPPVSKLLYELADALNPERCVMPIVEDDGTEWRDVGDERGYGSPE